MFRALASKDGLSLIAGLLLLAALAAWPSVAGVVTSGTRVSPAVAQESAEQPNVDVVVKLDFSPRAFHMKQLQKFGTIAGVSDDGITLLRVSPEDLDELANVLWIARIEPLP